MIKKFIFLTSVAASFFAFSQKTYTVVKGDNPYSIAKKLGMSHDELLRLNPKAKSGNLAIGDVLVINSKAKAQPKTSAPKVDAPKSAETATGKIYIQPKQTIYGITRKYHISEADLRKLNPGLTDNLQIGQEITVPASAIKKYGSQDPVKVETSNETFVPPPPSKAQASRPISTNFKDEFITYTVVEGDTVYSIINRFGISMDSLIALNPELSGGLKSGMVLKIKKVDAVYSKKNTAEGLNVVVLLPFGFDVNDNKYRTQAIDFLTGVKLAAERNTRLGQRINLNVIDSGNEQTLKSNLTQINQDNTDLIIGPFLKSNVKETLDYVSTKKIPVVAPFANAEDLYNYSNLIMVEADDKTFADRIIKEAAAAYSGQKIFIVADESRTYADYIKAGLEKSLSNPSVTVVKSALDLQSEKNMMTGQQAPIIAILANNSDSVGAAFANRLLEMNKTAAGIKAFSMYYAPIFEKKYNELGQVNLLYIMDRKVDSDGEFEKEIMADFKQKYCKSPSKFAIVGFDIMNDMLSRENKNGEIFKQITKSQKQLATKFEFVRTSPNGAYINTGYRVIRLSPQ